VVRNGSRDAVHRPCLAIAPERRILELRYGSFSEKQSDFRRKPFAAEKRCKHADNEQRRRSVAKKTLKSTRKPAVRRPSQGCEDRAQPLQDDARALPSVSSMRRRMVPAQRPHWALQPRQP
jgi:hypothetical protein